jgi:hypothetical protein
VGQAPDAVKVVLAVLEHLVWEIVFALPARARRGVGSTAPCALLLTVASLTVPARKPITPIAERATRSVRGGTACLNGVCAVTCGAGATLCSLDGGPGYCANLQTDNNNCGSCGNQCLESVAGVSTCRSGTCVWQDVNS